MAHSHIPHCGSLETFLSLLSHRNNCPFFPKLPYKLGLIPSPSAFPSILLKKVSLVSLALKIRVHKYIHSPLSDSKENTSSLNLAATITFFKTPPTLSLNPYKLAYISSTQIIFLDSKKFNKCMPGTVLGTGDTKEKRSQPQAVQLRNLVSREL